MAWKLAVTALRIAAALALLALLCLSLVPLLGPWPGDMVAPFRVQLAIAAIVGLGAVLPLKDLRLVGLADLVHYPVRADLVI